MLLRVYRYYDKNGDGKVTRGELRNAIAQTGLTLEYMIKADTDHDGLISAEEFVAYFDKIPDAEVAEMQQWLLEKQSQPAKEMLLQIFAMYDKNSDGLLSLPELEAGIKGTGLSKSYVARADKDGDQMISEEEWLQFFDPIPDNEIEEIRQWLGGSPDLSDVRKEC